LSSVFIFSRHPLAAVMSHSKRPMICVTGMLIGWQLTGSLCA